MQRSAGLTPSARLEDRSLSSRMIIREWASPPL